MTTVHVSWQKRAWKAEARIVVLEDTLRQLVEADRQAAFTGRYRFLSQADFAKFDNALKAVESLLTPKEGQ